MESRGSVTIEPASREELERRVVEIISANLCIEANSVSLSSSYKDLLACSYKELGADNLDLYSILMDLEEGLGVQIPDREAERIQTVADTVDYIQAQIERRSKRASSLRL